MKKSFALLSLFVFIVASFSGCFKKKSARSNKSSGNSELVTSSSGTDSSNLDFDRNVTSKTPDGDMVSGDSYGGIPAAPDEVKPDKKSFRSKSVGKSKTKFTLDDDVSEYEVNSKKSTENQKNIANSKVVIKKPRSSDASNQPSKNTSKQQTTKSDSSQKALGTPKQPEKPAEKKAATDSSGEGLTKEEKESLKKIAAAFKGWEKEKGSKNETSASQAQPTQQATDGLKTEKDVNNEPAAPPAQTTQPAAASSQKKVGSSSQEQQTKPKADSGLPSKSSSSSVSSPSVESVTLPQ